MTKRVNNIAKPKISVIMSVYNGGKNLRHSIESILKQSFNDFEFIVIDDCSTDNSYEIIKSFDDDRIRIIRNEVRLYLTKSLNKAIRMARGEYVARQDADDISLPHRLEKQVIFLEKNPEVAMVGTSAYLINEEGKVIGKRIVPSDPRKILLKVNPIIHGSVMIRKKIIDKLGLYNELFKYSQDYELWLRISKNYDIRNLQETLYCLRIHGSSIGQTKAFEQALYAILARKTATSALKLNEQLANSIVLQNMTHVYRYLTRWEKLLLYKTLIGSKFNTGLWHSKVGRVFIKVYDALRKCLDYRI